MGIHGIYKEIGPGERIALSKLAVEKYEQAGRPLRLAIDISIWLFQIQSGKGGTNPALRTFYYRLLRLISLSIHPLFVFDGPNKPPFKRNKRTGPNVASIPEFLAKQLLKQFGLPFHLAPGEAEAECALLQREGIVDAVLSEDVDTLMFGSGLTLRNWSSEGTLKTKVATHVNVYDAEKTKDGKSGLDREGMVLVALMSGGDYIPEGIPSCGPKLACEAARAGFGSDLCKTSRRDLVGIAEWRERLAYELRTNESKFFRQKHKALKIPEDFPNLEVLGYYTHPAVSSKEKLDRLRQALEWDQDINFEELRTFTAEAFDWRCLGGAKKFVRNLAPALLVRELIKGGEASKAESGNIEAIQERESKLVKAFHGKRNHVTTDNLTELRLTFCPIDLVKIDLGAEDPDEEYNGPGSDSEEDVLPVIDGEAPEPTSPSKKRGPSTYDPTQLDKIWVLETWVKIGVPLKVQDWEASFRDHKKYLAAKVASKNASKAAKTKRANTTGGMPHGALDAYTKITKPGISLASKLSSEKAPDKGNHNSEYPPLQKQDIRRSTPPPVFLDKPLPCLLSPPRSQQTITIEILSSPEAPFQAKASSSRLIPPISDATDNLPDSVTKRRRRTPLRRWESMPVSSGPSSKQRPITPPPWPPDKDDSAATASPDFPSPSDLFGIPRKNPSARATQARQHAVDIASSPPRTIPEWIRRSQSATPSKPHPINTVPPPSPAKPTFLLPSPVKELDMTMSSPERKKARSSRRPLTNTSANPGSGFEQRTQQSKSSSLTERDKPTTSLRRSPRQHSASFLPPPAAQPTKIKQQASKKRNITLRESLEGAWKFAESMDLTASPEKAINSSTVGRRKARTTDTAGTKAKAITFMGSDVSIVDLTDSPC